MHFVAAHNELLVRTLRSLPTTTIISKNTLKGGHLTREGPCMLSTL